MAILFFGGGGGVGGVGEVGGLLHVVKCSTFCMDISLSLHYIADECVPTSAIFHECSSKQHVLFFFLAAASQ